MPANDIPLSESGSITGNLRPALVSLRRSYRSGNAVTLADLTQTLGPDCALLLSFTLALPFLSPISLGPFTTPVSMVLLLLGWGIARGQKQLPVPERYLKVPLPLRAFNFIRWAVLRIARRRGESSPGAAVSRRAGGALIMIGAVLLAAPIPLLPLTNTIPALAILLAAAAVLKGRRGMLVGSAVASVLSVLYFAGLAAAALFLGGEALGSFGAAEAATES